MPLYEYRCAACEHEFELLVRTVDIPRCPECSGEDLTRLISAFSVSCEQGRQTSLKSARKAAAKRERERIDADHKAAHQHHH